jgi:hypothetical protein
MGRGARLLREPTLHFFILGALLFLAHRLIVGDDRVIVISGGLKADLERRLSDQNGRRPTAAELEVALDVWKQDEVLYREAIHERLDREDATVRKVLADRMRARAVQEMTARSPTDAELDAWLDSHRQQYETPLRYDFESVAFSKSEGTAEERRSKFQRALASGAKPAMLGRSILGGNLTRADLTEKFGPVLAASICGLPIGAWQPLETDASLLLARVIGIEGGLPSREAVRPALIYDWGVAMKQQAVERMVSGVLGRYQFKEKP